MDDTSSAFYLPNSLQKVSETLSVSPKYTSDEILERVDAEFQSRFVSEGQSLDVDSGSVGQLLEQSAVDLIESAVSITSMTCNQLNLNYSQSSFLDTIASLFRLRRKYKMPTRVLCRFWGQEFTTIPAGSTVADDDTHSFTVETTLTISLDGSSIEDNPSPYYQDGYVVCAEKAEIEIPIHTITTISTGVLGWESVDNIAAGETGQDEESDANFRRRVKNCRYRGTAFIKAVRSRIMSIEGVKNCYVYENGTDKTKFIDADGNVYQADSRPSGNTDPAIMPHSTIIIVDGGKEADVAEAIMNTKSVGSNLTPLYTISGTEAAQALVLVDTTETHELVNTYVKTVPVQDPAYDLKYSITYNLGETLPYKAKVTVIRKKYEGTASSLSEAVKAAIDAWQGGNSPYVDGLTLGQQVYKYELSAAISDAIPEIQIKNVQLFTKDSSDAWVEVSGNHVPVKIYQKAVSTAADNEVVVYGETN